ncbi:MAG: SAM-dependent methyltransferase [Actinomycetota bacterium]|nr:SAM-dependent methyltransferase [Actinomycetota bacterium]
MTSSPPDSLDDTLLDALDDIRSALLNEVTFVGAVASGRRRGRQPRWRRVELRPVVLSSGAHLQVTRYDDTQSFTDNHRPGAGSAAAVEELLAEPFGSWAVTTTRERLGLQVTKKGAGVVHRHPLEQAVDPDLRHDRVKQHVLDTSTAYLRAVGITDEAGRVKPSRQAKFRQVEEFCRRLDQAVDEATTAGALPEVTALRPLRVVDLGCGNAYLTFAAAHLLTQLRRLPVRLVGVDVKEQARERNTALAAELGWSEQVSFERAGIASAPDVTQAPDIVLALHACDTATDEALARAVQWGAPLVLSAPCCHHDLQRRLKETAVSDAMTMVTRHGILRERLADVLTDAVRASLLRRSGYRVDVMEFVGSQHTPRNTLLRAIRVDDAGIRATGSDEYAGFLEQWSVTPRLAELLASPT